ncbi:MAG: ComF family protein, partial [Planctomycetota bacterium]
VDVERSTLVPVPNHWTHGLGGAADCAGELARELARRLGVSLARRAIVRTRSTAKQGMLTWAERRKNMRGAFRLRDAKMLTARHVILVDDVMTSGATLHELAKVARAGQAATIDAAVVARGTGTRDVPTPYFLKPETRKRSEHGHAGNDA